MPAANLLSLISESKSSQSLSSSGRFLSDTELFVFFKLYPEQIFCFLLQKHANELEKSHILRAGSPKRRTVIKSNPQLALVTSWHWSQLNAALNGYALLKRRETKLTFVISWFCVGPAGKLSKLMPFLNFCPPRWQRLWEPQHFVQLQ